MMFEVIGFKFCPSTKHQTFHVKLAACEAAKPQTRRTTNDLRATSHEQRTTDHGFSSDSDAAFRRNRLKTDNDASGHPQRVAGRPPLPSVRVTVLYRMGQNGSGTAPTDAAFRRDKLMK